LQLVSETGNGFPSSHAVAIVAVGAAVWYLWSIRPEVAWGGSWRAKARVGLLVVGLALLVGIGRVYEGAHYPSDVLAGWALGGVWASVCLTAAEVFRRLYENGNMGFSGGAVTPPAGQPSEPRQDAEPPTRRRRPGTFEYGSRRSGPNPVLGGG
jgi:membrane-associated phospholipid phosphatase